MDQKAEGPEEMNTGVQPDGSNVTEIRGKKAVARLVEFPDGTGSVNLYFVKRSPFRMKDDKKKVFSVAIRRVDLKAMGAKTILEAVKMAVNTGRVATISDKRVEGPLKTKAP